MGERYDCLVIGSGLAGLFAALTLRDGVSRPHHRGALEDSNSYFAHMAAAVGRGDSRICIAGIPWRRGRDFVMNRLWRSWFRKASADRT